ncbi:cyclic nucleotide-binding domain-containing protein [Neosynechococcus sphagnicola]|uniref:cyclic nucleotide-binding domain-containing protein n=1 Tax=Neosynechococcus sphagnicola TaxID=1501145 RepID=UPI00068C818D|nr:cyclic nucleotide-binding domain-containing protein [Neosynechococcus sphagnicola]
MIEVLRQTLSNDDLDWLTATGQQRDVPAGSVLIEKQQPLHPLYIVHSGCLQAMGPRDAGSPLGRAIAAIEEPSSEDIIGTYGSGELVGMAPLLGMGASMMVVKAVEPATVLEVPYPQVQEKLQQDLAFATRFYRLCIRLLQERAQQLVQRLIQRKRLQIYPLAEVLLLLGELAEGDIDWLSTHGIPEEVPAGTVLIQAGKPVTAVYLLLQGGISWGVSDSSRRNLTQILATLEADTPSAPPALREIAKLSAAEFFGESALMEKSLALATATALEDSLVLTLPSPQLRSHLEQDLGFAARLYRVIALLQAARSEERLHYLGFGKGAYRLTLATTETKPDNHSLGHSERLAVARSRLHSLLSHLQVQTG